MAEVAHGLVDAEGRLAQAEDALLGLAMRAGGGLGSAVSVPQLATLARLARRLQVPIARSVLVADHEADIELFVRARPDGANVRLAVAGWREWQAWKPAGERVESDLLSAGSEWRWTCDAALRLAFIAPEAGVRHGFDAAELLGKPLTQLFDFEPGPKGELPMLAALADRRSFSAQPAKVRTSSQAVLVSAVARTGVGGVFGGFKGGVRSVELPASRPGPVHEIGDRLERALRKPLSQIIANADSIHAGADGPIACEYAAYAADIASAGRHLMSLVDDLADLDMVERPDFAPELEPIDLADLARRAAGLLSVRASNAGVTIARPGPDEQAPALGNFRRVLQVLVNVIGNAVRYSPQGEAVTVAVAPGPGVTVSDMGEGIAPEDQARIFDKFARLDPSEVGGSGLGLYIARRLARAMGGDLNVESAPGAGARFTLGLRPDPASDQDQHQP